MNRAMTAAPRPPSGLTDRAGRLARRYVDVYRSTGSASSVVGYFARHLAAKAKGLRSNVLDTSRIRADVRATKRRAVAPLVAVKAIGGLGDYLVMARYLRDLEIETGPIAFDVYANNVSIAQWVFSSLPSVRECLPERSFARLWREYPAALATSQAVSVTHADPDLEEATETAALARITAHIAGFEPRLSEMIASQPFFDGELAQEAVAMGYRRGDFLHAMSGIPYGGDRLSVRADPAAPARHGLAGVTYVTVQNGFDAEFMVRNGTATKCYPHFGEVVARLKQAAPDIKIVQVGTRTSTPIPDVDLNLISRTSLPEVAGVLAGARIHIDNEAGLVHLASCLGVQSCVVFGPTSADYFGYPGNINIEPADCGNCWWATESWMEVCPKGYTAPLCMTQQRPQEVASRILEYNILPARTGRRSASRQDRERV